MSIAENIAEINKKITAAAEKSGRKREDILLLAVTKTIDIPRIKEVTELGYTELGENKVQEIMSKYDELDGVQWHLIGHLQTNKVKYIADKVKMIHSVDSLKLGTEISKRCGQCGRIMDILVEINIAGEEAKHGVPLDMAEKLACELAKLENIRVRGLMTVAPYDPEPENNRKYFKNMYKLFIDIKSKRYDNINMEYLSMGMTNDYEAQI